MRGRRRPFRGGCRPTGRARAGAHAGTTHWRSPIAMASGRPADRGSISNRGAAFRGAQRGPRSSKDRSAERFRRGCAFVRSHQSGKDVLPTQFDWWSHPDMALGVPAHSVGEKVGPKQAKTRRARIHPNKYGLWSRLCRERNEHDTAALTGAVRVLGRNPLAPITYGVRSRFFYVA